MSARAAAAAALALASTWTAPGSAQDSFERQVLDAVNAVRADPAAYARTLETYRQEFVGLRVRDPDTGELHTTREGSSAVAEAEVVLSHRAPVPPLAWSPLLARSAADLARQQALSGRVGHFGPRGESLADRVRRYGDMRGMVAEGIAYGQPDAAGVVRAFVVDDGVPDRSHRRDMLDPTFRYAGVSCGPHPVYRVMCVVDYAAP